jgi:hypothetical protein
MPGNMGVKKNILKRFSSIFKKDECSYALPGFARPLVNSSI